MDHEGEPDPPPERTSGITLETCYRHPQVVTGVHCTRCGRPICTDCMRPAAVGYQCPECQAQAARSAPRRRVQVRFLLGRPGIVTTTLLIANMAMFLVEIAKDPGGVSVAGGFSNLTLFNLGALVPIVVARQGQYWRLFTVMFLHADLLHIFFNMYGLYLFGYLIENALGRARFLAVYFISGFIASAASYTFADPNVLAVGASGAIFGLLGAWVAYNWRRRNIAANRFQLQWAAMLIAINLVLGVTIAQIDNYAHIGGLIAGMAAGTLAEGIGPRETRTLSTVIGLTALVAVGVVMVVYRTSVLA